MKYYMSKKAKINNKKIETKTENIISDKISMKHKAQLLKTENIISDKISMKHKAQLLIIHASIKGMNQRQLWSLYEVLVKSPNDEFKPLIFKLLDNEFDKRKIQHDFSKDYKNDK